MVNFNNEATVSTPAINVMKILLLQSRENLIEALEFYNKKVTEGVNIEQSPVKARLGTLFLQLQPYLERTYKEKEYNNMLSAFQKNIFFNEKDIPNGDLLKLFIQLNNLMDSLKITRVDTRIQYDRTDIELDNAMNDLN